MEILGIKFAPLWLPFHRRLETLSAFTVIFMLTGFSVASLCIAFALSFSSFWWLMVLYVIWIVKDRKTAETGGRPNVWVQNWNLFQYAKNYYPVTLTTVPGIKFDPKRNYIACSFPHGLFPMGIFTALRPSSTEKKGLFPHHQVLPVTLTINFFIPFYRELMLSLGFCNAKRESINHILQTSDGGKVIALIVGGAAEAQYASEGTYHLVLKNRKGFIKVALENGTSLVPLFSFGETGIYKVVTFPEGSRFRGFQEWVKKLTGILPIVFYGRGFLQYTFGLVPFRHPINVVVGNPIDVEKKTNPTQQEIDALHKRFVEELTNLFEEYKYKFEKNPKNARVIFI